MAPFRIDTNKRKKLLAFIRGGGHPEAAAVAAGLDLDWFRAAMRRGKDGGSGYGKAIFPVEVRMAWAIARLAADVKMHQAKPAEWLKHGPGQAFSIGAWKRFGELAKQKESEAKSGDSMREVGEFLAWCMEGLEPFPEARKALGERVAQMEPPKQLGKSSGK